MLPEIFRNRGALVGPTMDDFIERVFYGWPTLQKTVDVAWRPRVDVYETDSEITIDLELPGLEKKDIKVEVKNNFLTISGERKREEKKEKAESHSVERHYGRFERTFGLPDTVAVDKVSAEFKNGVLSVTMPKTEKAIPRELDITVK
jgi:HSP20 family protein